MEPDVDALDAYSRAVTTVAAALLPSVASLTVQSRRGNGAGSAVVFTPDGLTLTSAHVVEGATSGLAEFTSGEETRFDVVGADPLADLAVLRLHDPAASTRPATLGDADTLRIGQLVIADARLDGIKVAVIIDTGAQGSIGNLALQNRMRSRDRGTTDLTDINGVTASGEIGIARRLDLGRARIESFPIVYHDAAPFRALGLDDRPAMVLGMGELRLFKRVAIDFNKRRVLFDMPDGSRRSRPGNWFDG